MAAGQMHRAVVTRTSTTGVWISISSIYPGIEFGPCDIVANAVRLDLSPAVTGLADFLEAGDDVLAVETSDADFLIVGAIRTGVSANGGL